MTVKRRHYKKHRICWCPSVSLTTRHEYQRQQDFDDRQSQINSLRGDITVRTIGPNSYPELSTHVPVTSSAAVSIKLVFLHASSDANQTGAISYSKYEGVDNKSDYASSTYV
jgi:hypothetical protein